MRESHSGGTHGVFYFFIFLSRVDRYDLPTVAMKFLNSLAVVVVALVLGAAIGILESELLVHLTEKRNDQ